MGYTIETVVDAGDDVLLVTATDAQGNQVHATGWVSATTNHYDPASYDSHGNLAVGARPRAMTAAEVGAYALSLLDAQNAPAPTPIVFSPPAS